MATNNGTCVLLVGTDHEKFDHLTAYLEAAGYGTRVAESIPVARCGVVQDVPFAIVIDASVGDPGWAWAFSRELAEGVSALIVILVRHADPGAHVKALSSGADQCLDVRPGYFQMLVVYLNRQAGRLERLEQQSSYADVRQQAVLELDPENRRAYREGLVIPLTGRECSLLRALARQPSRPVSAGELCQVLWKAKPPGAALGLLKQYVGRLRRKIEPDPDHPVYVETVRSIGYCFHPSGRHRKPEEPSAGPAEEGQSITAARQG